MAEKLEGKKLQDALEQHPDWHADDGKLIREWTFPNFDAAIEFVNGVAKLADAAGHHPDIDIRYNKVKLSLITHDSGGITAKDVEMAAKLDTRFGR